MSTAAVVLAAGGGTRFAGQEHKLLTPLRGRPVVAWAVSAAADAGLDELIVVSGAVELGGAGLPDAARLVHNPEWRDGIASSLRAGIAAAEAAAHGAVVIGLGDQPLVTSGAWRAVAAASAPIAVATYDGARRNPVRLHRSVWSLLPSTGDEGARALMRDRPELVTEVPCTGEPADVDTVEDLEQWS